MFSGGIEKVGGMKWVNWLISKARHCVKSVRIWSFSDLYFPAFGLSTERYGVSVCI